MEPDLPPPASRPAPFGELEYQGFRTPGELWDEGFASVPKRMGVYQVLWRGGARPLFLDRSPAGRFKGRDPSVSTAELRENWIEGADALYIGKAGEGGRKSTLRSRIRSMVRFGRGQAIGHWGGRLVWQLADTEDLLFAWSPVGRGDPRRVEDELLRRFRERHGRLPFANLTGPPLAE